MTRAQLAETLGAYGAGLAAEVSLLQQLQLLSAQEQDAGHRDELGRVATLSDERERVMAALLAVESQIQPMRPVLAVHRESAADLPGFAEVVTLHRVASQLVSTILTADAATRELLQLAAAARRAATQALENGGQTLSAYQRAIAPRITSAALMDRHG